MRSLLPLLAALPLFACQPAGDKADTGEVLAEETGIGAGPTGRSGDPVAGEAENAAIPANIDEGVEPGAALKPTNIPEQFRGRWGLVAADCKGGAVAKGLLTIDDSRLVFYESRGVLDRIDAWQPASRFTANYGFRGEGLEWERLITLERTGNKLRRTEQGGEEGPVDLTYTACPA
jgi:hypothetical protein